MISTKERETVAAEHQEGRMERRKGGREGGREQKDRKSVV